MGEKKREEQKLECKSEIFYSSLWKSERKGILVFVSVGLRGCGGVCGGGAGVEWWKAGPGVEYQRG